MSDSIKNYNELFEGLTALAESAFPKKCVSCGRIFESANDFLTETQDIPTAKSSLKESEEEDGSIVVEVFRNCPCGSTLMDFFSDRRDFSDKGIQRRNKFEELIQFLGSKGIDKNIARIELLKVLQGKKSEILSAIHPPSRKS